MKQTLILAAIFSAFTLTSQAAAVQTGVTVSKLTIASGTPMAVPEPTAFALVGLAGIAIILRRRK